MRGPALRTLRVRLGPLAFDEAAGWRALCTTIEARPDGIGEEVLRDYMAVDIYVVTWRQWLRTYGRLQALP